MGGGIRFVTPSELGFVRRVRSPYRSEEHPGHSRVLAVIAPGVAIEKPLADVPQGSLIARIAEYSPDDLRMLDVTLSDPIMGSQVYQKAKGAIFDSEAVNPARRRAVRSPGGELFVVNSFRSRISEWLIRGLANKNNARLLEIGIVPGPDIEDRLRYASGQDFTPRQYEVMATVLEEIVTTAVTAAGGKGMHVPDHSTLRNYIRSVTRLPRLDWWELLSVFGTVNDEIMNAYLSKNKEQFSAGEGFYWAIRMFDVMRSFLRKRHVFYNGRPGEGAVEKKSYSHGSSDWDYIPAREALASLTGGQVQAIDERYDAVLVIENIRLPGQSGSFRNAKSLEAVASETGEAGKPSGIYIKGKFSSLPQPKLILKEPTHLWMDFFSLYNVANMMLLLYLGKLGERLPVNGIGIGYSPVPVVMQKFVPSLKILLKPDLFDSQNGGSSNGNTGRTSLEQRLIQEIVEGKIDVTLQLPEGTLLQLFSVMKGIGAQIPPEMVENALLKRQIEELESYRNLKGQLSVDDRRYVLETFGFSGILTTRDVARLLEHAKKRRGSVLRTFGTKYGDDLRAFVGIDVSGSNSHEPPFSVNGKNGQKYDPSVDTYAGMLSLYGLSAARKYAYLALPVNLANPPPEIRSVIEVRRNASDGTLEFFLRNAPAARENKRQLRPY